jgi:omega-6 fatty acid desaturase (delta-12 desaturase)
MTQSEFRHARLALSQRKIVLPVALFIAVALAFGVTVTAALAGPPLIAIPLGVASGIIVCMLFVIGHDACHQSFTSSRWLNHLIGRLAFLPSLHNYSLWDFEHNRRHHRFNNIRHLDHDLAPMTPDEFAGATSIRRLKYRIFRAPAGVPFYYLLINWPARLVVPRRKLLGKIRAVHVMDVALVWSFLAVYLAALTIVGGWFGNGIVISVSVGFLIPFLVFNLVISVAIFLHHTHPAVPWYADVAQWERENGRIYGVVHVEFPWIVRKLFFQIMEHNAHHYAPGVPLYRLEPMQELMKDAGAVSWRITMQRYLGVCRCCKLFDYERRRWVAFDGHPAIQPRWKSVLPARVSTRSRPAAYAYVIGKIHRLYRGRGIGQQHRPH